MCKFCQENYEINTMISERQVVIKLNEEQKEFVKIRFPFQGGGGITKTIQITFCPFCGRRLRRLKGFTESYEVLEPYTTEVNWKGKEVWINIHTEQKKIIITEDVCNDIKQSFELLKLREQGLI